MAIDNVVEFFSGLFDPLVLVLGVLLPGSLMWWSSQTNKQLTEILGIKTDKKNPSLDILIWGLFSLIMSSILISGIFPKTDTFLISVASLSLLISLAASITTKTLNFLLEKRFWSNNSISFIVFSILIMLSLILSLFFLPAFTNLFPPPLRTYSIWLTVNNNCSAVNMLVVNQNTVPMIVYGYSFEPSNTVYFPNPVIISPSNNSWLSFNVNSKNKSIISIITDTAQTSLEFSCNSISATISKHN